MTARFVTLALALLAAAPAAAQDFPAVELPRPTGPHAIGTRTAVVVDSIRRETFGPDSGAPRRLRVRFWYPAAEPTGPTAPYMDAPTAATWVERHGFPEGFHERVRTHSVEEATPTVSAEPWPLLLFSHGMSWPAAMYQSFFEELASHGYVVAAVDHTGYSDAILFPDGHRVGFEAWSEPPATEEERRARLAAHMGTWVADLRRALDWIEEARLGGDPFFERIATSQVGAFGHSYGGGAAARLLSADPRVVAAANLEGGAYGPDTTALAISEPLLHVVAGYNERDLVATEFSPADAPLYEVLIHGTFHSTFSDLIHLHAVQADSAWLHRHRFDLEPARALRITNDYLRAFFDRYLRRIDGPAEDLLHLRSAADLEGSSSRGYPEVELRLDY